MFADQFVEIWYLLKILKNVMTVIQTIMMAAPQVAKLKQNLWRHLLQFKIRELRAMLLSEQHQLLQQLLPSIVLLLLIRQLLSYQQQPKLGKFLQLLELLSIFLLWMLSNKVLVFRMYFFFQKHFSFCFQRNLNLKKPMIFLRKVDLISDNHFMSKFKEQYSMLFILWLEL